MHERQMHSVSTTTKSKSDAIVTTTHYCLYYYQPLYDFTHTYKPRRHHIIAQARNLAVCRKFYQI